MYVKLAAVNLKIQTAFEADTFWRFFNVNVFSSLRTEGRFCQIFVAISLTVCFPMLVLNRDLYRLFWEAYGVQCVGGHF